MNVIILNKFFEETLIGKQRRNTTNIEKKKDILRKKHLPITAVPVISLLKYFNGF